MSSSWLGRTLGLLAIVATFGLSPLAEAGHNAISGRVLDRNGKPVERAIVTLAPGNVQLITDTEGRFLIDYLRDDAGTRVKLARKANYQLEVFKPGFRTEAMQFYYKAGALAIDDMTLAEDSIQVTDDAQNLDPGLFSDRTQSSGATYEGQ
jgi:hypothetical protein